MEEWELDFEWLSVRHYVKAKFNREDLPNLNAILFLIGIQELGFVKKFSKEEKQDLMHIAVCKLLSADGYYEYIGRDEENWPHYQVSKIFRIAGVKNQEKLLKTKVIEYFRHMRIEEEE